MLPRARTAAPGSLSSDPVVPLLPRRRVVGLPFGDSRSIHRHGRFDPIGSRPYRPGDDPRLIDRHASARLTSVSDRDELMVREYLADERGGVGLVIDRSPTMALYPSELPWLHKPAASAAVAHIVSASAQRARSPLVRLACLPGADKPRTLRRGSFVFVVSDFLAFPTDDAWDVAITSDWDLIPVVVQDPIWEQSFPDVAGVTLPLADPAGRTRPVRLTRAEAQHRREQNEARYAATIGRLEDLGLEVVALSTADPDVIFDSLLTWAEGRRGPSAWTA